MHLGAPLHAPLHVNWYRAHWDSSDDCRLFLGVYMNAVVYRDKTAGMHRQFHRYKQTHLGGFVAIQDAVHK